MGDEKEDEGSREAAEAKAAEEVKAAEDAPNWWDSLVKNIQENEHVKKVGEFANEKVQEIQENEHMKEMGNAFQENMHKVTQSLEQSLAEAQERAEIMRIAEEIIAEEERIEAAEAKALEEAKAASSAAEAKALEEAKAASSVAEAKALEEAKAAKALEEAKAASSSSSSSSSAQEPPKQELPEQITDWEKITQNISQKPAERRPEPVAAERRPEPVALPKGFFGSEEKKPEPVALPKGFFGSPTVERQEPPEPASPQQGLFGIFDSPTVEPKEPAEPVSPKQGLFGILEQGLQDKSFQDQMKAFNQQAPQPTQPAPDATTNQPPEPDQGFQGIFKHFQQKEAPPEPEPGVLDAVSDVLVEQKETLAKKAAEVQQALDEKTEEIIEIIPDDVKELPSNIQAGLEHGIVAVREKTSSMNQHIQQNVVQVFQPAPEPVPDDKVRFSMSGWAGGSVLGWGSGWNTKWEVPTWYLEEKKAEEKNAKLEEELKRLQDSSSERCKSLMDQTQSMQAQMLDKKQAKELMESMKIQYLKDELKKQKDEYKAKEEQLQEALQNNANQKEMFAACSSTDAGSPDPEMFRKLIDVEELIEKAKDEIRSLKTENDQFVQSSIAMSKELEEGKQELREVQEQLQRKQVQRATKQVETKEKSRKSSEEFASNVSHHSSEGAMPSPPTSSTGPPPNVHDEVANGVFKQLPVSADEVAQKSGEVANEVANGIQNLFFGEEYKPSKTKLRRRIEELEESIVKKQEELDQANAVIINQKKEEQEFVQSSKLMFEDMYREQMEMEALLGSTERARSKKGKQKAADAPKTYYDLQVKKILGLEEQVQKNKDQMAEAQEKIENLKKEKDKVMASAKAMSEKLQREQQAMMDMFSGAASASGSS